MPRKLRDLRGEQFGRVRVVIFAGFRRCSGVKRAMWKVECSCGTVFITRGGSLTEGKTRSCGCIADEIKRNRSRDITINGVSQRLTSWAKWYGIRPGIIYDRIRGGMDVEQAITTPVGKRGHRIRQNSFCTSSGQ